MSSNSEETMANAAAAVTKGGCIVAIFATIIPAVWFPLTVLNGLVLYKYWGWFVLPVFPNLPVITFWQAVGIGLVVSFLTKSNSSIKSEYENPLWMQYLMGVVAPLINLFFGWLIHLFFLR